MNLPSTKIIGMVLYLCYRCSSASFWLHCSSSTSRQLNLLLACSRSRLALRQKEQYSAPKTTIFARDLPSIDLNRLSDMIPVAAAEYKLVLVGDSAVGKSSLLCQFVDGKFDEQLLSTIGVDFKFRRVKIGSEEVKLQIWDTAGQETFRSIVSAYYNSADAILLCYDISSYDSFESLKDYWLPEAQNNNKTNAKIFVIGNKLDAKREVQSYSLDSLKDSAITAFFEVSAKENTNVVKSFTEIARVLHQTKPAGKPEKAGEATQLRKPAVKPKEAFLEGQEQVVTKKGSCCK